MAIISFLNKILNGSGLIIRKVNDSSITVNGNKYQSTDKVIYITVDGDLDRLEVGSATVIINGNVTGGIQTGSGSVSVTGDVQGNLKTGSGEVECTTVSGNVETGSGDIITTFVSGRIQTNAGSIRRIS